MRKVHKWDVTNKKEIGKRLTFIFSKPSIKIDIFRFRKITVGYEKLNKWRGEGGGGVRICDVIKVGGKRYCDEGVGGKESQENA